MLTVKYDPINGIPVADGKALDVVLDLIDTHQAIGELEYTTSSRFLTEVLHLAIIEEKISYKDVTIVAPDGASSGFDEKGFYIRTIFYTDLIQETALKICQHHFNQIPKHT